MLQFEIFCLRALETVFFIGVTGCAFTVVFSWVSILRSGLSRDDGLREIPEVPLPRATSYHFNHRDPAE